ncbi:MAG: hypothetical protein AAF497_01465, partial [Planctomycetota bacterium]
MKLAATSLALVLIAATLGLAQIEIPSTQAEWEKQRAATLASLKEVSFSGWPATPPPLNAKIAFEERKNGVELRAVDFDSEEEGEDAKGGSQEATGEVLHASLPVGKEAACA